MPTYDYVCTQCHHEFEAFQSIKDEPLKTCPACQTQSVKRKVGGGAGLIFKGTGFYITDYKKSSGGGESAGGGKSEGKTSESKPAAPATS